MCSHIGSIIEALHDPEHFDGKIFPGAQPFPETGWGKPVCLFKRR